MQFLYAIGVWHLHQPAEESLSFPKDAPLHDKSDPGPMTPIAREGGEAIFATSTPITTEALGDPLTDDVLPDGTPDSACQQMYLRNFKGEVNNQETTEYHPEFRRPVG